MSEGAGASETAFSSGRESANNAGREVHPDDRTALWFVLQVVAGVVAFGYLVGLAVATPPEALPWNARIALYFAGFCCVLFIRGVWRLSRLKEKDPKPRTFEWILLLTQDGKKRWKKLLKWLQPWGTLGWWISGGVAMLVGYLIGTTVFR